MTAPKSANSNSNSQANPMWGGQYDRPPADIMAEINASIGFDKALYRQDIAGSIAHATMLVAQGIITAADGDAIMHGLSEVLAEMESGTFTFKTALEDIHMNVESRLTEIIGEPAGRLHTARSRNDQVALDLRLYVRDAIDWLDREFASLQAALIARAEEHADTVMPGFTHLQTAQPVTLGHHLLAYVEMFSRDRARMQDCRKRLNECPLGAAALAGTSFPINRQQVSDLLEFDHPMRNSLDAVSARDYALEFMAAAGICMAHLSRLAEEFVVWSSPLVGFVRFSDAFSTGSSIMPQKRNPDAAELIRGKAGRVFGNLMALFATVKALPLAYNKDMQEDKEPVFDTCATLSLGLRAMRGMVADFTADAEAMRAAAGGGYSTATDLADWLVRAANIPFRQAHHITARVVKRADELGMQLDAMPLSELQAVDARITQEALGVLSAENSVKSRTSFGGTAPQNVRKMIAWYKERL